MVLLDCRTGRDKIRGGISIAQNMDRSGTERSIKTGVVGQKGQIVETDGVERCDLNQ